MSNPEQPGYPGPGGENPYGAPQQPNPYGQPQQPQYQPPPYPQYQQNPYQQQPWQQPSGYPPPYQAAPPNESLATPALIIGIVSLVLTFSCGIGALGSPAAMIMGRVSMKRIDRSNGQLGGRGTAMAGFILGIVGTVLLVLGIIALVLFITVGVYSDSSTSG